MSRPIVFLACVWLWTAGCLPAGVTVERYTPKPAAGRTVRIDGFLGWNMIRVDFQSEGTWGSSQP